MKYIRTIISYIALVVFSLTIVDCANPVSPTGGPKDVTPPKMLKSEPPMFTRNFNAKKIQIYFDEYIQLKEMSQQLIISPPMGENPVIKLKGKSVVVEFQEELKDSTTYNIFFGNGIVDLTENNPASNFQYIFSTGNILDSLTIKGAVKDAFSLESIPGLNVMLYMNNNDTIPFDSLPYYVKPYYYSRTDENGNFQFYNLMNKSFKLFVLEDANSNMLFDQKLERIAFIDSLVSPFYIPPIIEPDTIADSLAIPEIDTSFVFQEPDPIQLYLFQEKDTVQRFIKASVIKSGKLMFVFKESTHSPDITPLNIPNELDWKIEEFNETRDTINFWITEEIPDTVTFVISDKGLVLDTITMSTLVRYKNKKERERALEEGPPKLIVKFGKETQLNTPQKIRFNYPIKEYDISGSMLVENEDTLVPEFRIADSLGIIGEISHKWLENASYRFMIPDSAFFGLGGQSHDTLKHNLTTKALADYGNLYINVTVVDSGTNHIVQLLNKDRIVKQFQTTYDTHLSFEYLLPGEYTIKVIVDKNDNKKWDTGNYILGIQPETVFYFVKVITIRANWDITEDWTF